MTKAGKESSGFFVGYHKRLPAALRWFLPLVGGALIGGFAALGALTAGVQSDPGDGRFVWDAGPQSLTGLLEAEPYPILHVAPNARFPKGRTLMLNGEGKRGVQGAAAALDGKLVDAGGILLKRGALDMLQIGGDGGLRRAAQGSEIPAKPTPRDLGRWRLTGELCDGKCYAGAMRPGSGIAHKACANLCIIGGLPPVFVANGSVAGRSFLLAAGADGKALPPRVLDYVGATVSAEGRIEERGDLLIFKIEVDSLKVL